jgi:hypothetical protein
MLPLARHNLVHHHLSNMHLVFMLTTSLPSGVVHIWQPFVVEFVFGVLSLQQVS